MLALLKDLYYYYYTEFSFITNIESSSPTDDILIFISFVILFVPLVTWIIKFIWRLFF